MTNVLVIMNKIILGEIMKRVIHFKVPLLNNGMVDRLAISPELLGKFLQLIKNHLGDEFLITASPLEPSELVLEGSELKFYNFDMEQIGVEELIKLIKE